MTRFVTGVNPTQRSLRTDSAVCAPHRSCRGAIFAAPSIFMTSTIVRSSILLYAPSRSAGGGRGRNEEGRPTGRTFFFSPFLPSFAHRSRIQAFLRRRRRPSPVRTPGASAAAAADIPNECVPFIDSPICHVIHSSAVTLLIVYKCSTDDVCCCCIPGRQVVRHLSMPSLPIKQSLPLID